MGLKVRMFFRTVECQQVESLGVMAATVFDGSHCYWQGM